MSAVWLKHAVWSAARWAADRVGIRVIMRLSVPDGVLVELDLFAADAAVNHGGQLAVARPATPSCYQDVVLPGVAGVVNQMDIGPGSARREKVRQSPKRSAIRRATGFINASR